MPRHPQSLVQSHLDRARRVIDLELAGLTALQEQLDFHFASAVELLRETIAAEKKIVVTGVGKSGHIGAKISATLASTGAPSVLLDPVNATHGDLGVVVPGDVILVLSYSGETEEIIRLIPSLKRMSIKIISITGKPRSTLAKASDIHLCAKVNREACPLNLAPTASTTATLALGDALAMVLLEARGFKKEDFASFHPGGSLGRNLLLKISDIMRPVENMAILPTTFTVNEALEAFSQRRTGAAAVVDSTGKLVGIYTHGDFCRGYRNDPHVGQNTLANVMTVKPITVLVDKLAVEVLNIFEAHSIDDLVVVNRQHRPVGLVDAQDLAKHKLL